MSSKFRAEYLATSLDEETNKDWIADTKIVCFEVRLNGSLCAMQRRNCKRRSEKKQIYSAQYHQATTMCTTIFVCGFTLPFSLHCVRTTIEKEIVKTIGWSIWVFAAALYHVQSKLLIYYYYVLIINRYVGKIIYNYICI